MAETSYPYASDPMPETAWEDLVEPWQDDGVIVSEAQGLDALLVEAGTGMQPTVDVGGAVMRGIRYDNTALKTLAAFGASHATLDRFDRVALKYDRAVPSIVIVVVQGTAGAGAPTLTNTATVTYLPLAKVKVRATANSIINTDITDERWFAGQRLRSVSSSLVPTVVGPWFRHERDTNRVVFNDGTTDTEILAAGAQKLMVPNGFKQWTAGGIAVSTAVTGASWADFSGAPASLGTITLPGVSGVLYHVHGSAWAMQTDTSNVYGRLGIRNNSGGALLQTGRPFCARESPAGMFDIGHVDWYWRGAGSPITVKLSVQKIGGAWNFQAGHQLHLLGYDLGRVAAP